MVEFAIVLTLSLIILMVTIQFAIIGNAQLAVTQLSYAAARHAAVYPTDNTNSTYKNMASPVLNQANLTVDVSPAGRTFGVPVTVTVTYDLKGNMFLPNPFLGVSFPAQLSGIQTTMLTE